MDELAARLRRERAATALVPLFFLSGATGLVYQTVWSRQLHLVFGTSTFAIATVLAAFMGGLAVGGWAMSRMADTLERPLAVYGWLEVGIGLYAVAFPVLLDLATPLFLSAWRAGVQGPWASGVLQLAIVGAALLPPTAAMGATLPLLARFAILRLGSAGDRVGLLYAVNTTGAVVGTWLAGFVLLPAWGLWMTTVAAAVANLGLGGAAVGLDRWSGPGAVQAGEEDDEPPPVAPDRARRAARLSAALAGFSALVLEVAWFRVLGLMLGASVYAFSTMLLAFLVGIAAGGRVGGRLSDARHAAGGVDAVLRALALVQVAVAGTSILLMHVYQELPFLYVGLFDALRAETDPSWMWIASLVLAGLVMTPPAVAMGMAFPLAVRATVDEADAVGTEVGRVYAANTAGGVLGAALAGFVLLPTLAVTGTVLLAAFVEVCAGWTAWSGQAEGHRARPVRLGVATSLVAAVALLFPPAWDPLLMTAGMYKYVTSFEDHSREGIRNYAVEQYDLLYYREGLSSVVTVARNHGSGNMWLANNGKVDASTTSDMPTQLLVSLLPMQFVEDRAAVCVVGLASGISAGAAGLPAGVETLDVVELEPAIVEAAAFFEDFNFGVLHDPRATRTIDDGRTFLLRAAPSSWDVIVSEPSNPWITGVSNLFTAELFTLGRTRVRPGGAWSQWVQLYGMDDEDLRTLLITFADAWPHVLVYAAADAADLVLVGSGDPIRPTLQAAARLLDDPDVAQALATIDVATPVEVAARYLFDRDAIVAVASTAPRNTDDNMRIEYRAPRNLHRSTQRLNADLLRRMATVPVADLGDDPGVLLELAHAYRALDDHRAVEALVRGGLALPPGEDRRDESIRTALTWWLEDHDDPDATGAARAAAEARFLRDVVQPLLHLDPTAD